MKDYIDAAAFKEMILCADAALHKNIQAINDLNVFPVPDGDTGTNMGLTINNAAAELRKKDFDTVSSAADCVAGAMLRGARGNSGVILSLLFRGISKRLKGLDTAGAAEFTGAMSDGVAAAYKAVMKPAEGTILTVSRLAAKAASKAADKGASLEDALIAGIKAGSLALEDTVNQNPVLKKAGVIDAGGKGYMVILEAILASLRGEVISGEEGERDYSESDLFSSSGDVLMESITFAFDTVYVVRKSSPDVDLDPLRRYLSSIGDSLVISDDDEIFKVHVHTDMPGNALNESQKYGTLELAKIENMVTQAEQLKAGKKAQTTDDLDEIDKELTAMESASALTVEEEEYVAGADEIALIIQLNTEEDIGLLVFDYSVDGRKQSGGISNANKTLLKHDEQMIWVWNREDLECSADVINLTIQFRIITEYVDPNYENVYPDSLTRALAPISFEARFGESYSFDITGDSINGYQISQTE